MTSCQAGCTPACCRSQSPATSLARPHSAPHSLTYGSQPFPTPYPDLELVPQSHMGPPGLVPAHLMQTQQYSSTPGHSMAQRQFLPPTSNYYPPPQQQLWAVQQPPGMMLVLPQASVQHAQHSAAYPQHSMHRQHQMPYMHPPGGPLPGMLHLNGSNTHQLPNAYSEALHAPHNAMEPGNWQSSPAKPWQLADPPGQQAHQASQQEAYMATLSPGLQFLSPPTQGPTRQPASHAAIVPMHSMAHVPYSQQQLQHAHQSQQIQQGQQAQQAQHAQQGQQAQHAQQGQQDNSSAAFIVWADGHFKQMGQTAKRVELRHFVKQAKVGAPIHVV